MFKHIHFHIVGVYEIGASSNDIEIKKTAVNKIPILVLLQWGKSWLYKYALCFVFFVSIITIFTVSEDSGGAWLTDISQFGTFIQVIIDPFLSMINSLSCFLATLLTFFFFEKTREWSAVLGCGVSPGWIACVILSMSLFASAMIQLHLTRSASQSVKESDLNESFPLQINNGTDGVWYFGSFSPKTMEGQGLQLYLNDQDGESCLRLRCERTTWSIEEGWTFYNGIWWAYKTKRGVPIPDTETLGIKWLESEQFELFDELREKNVPVRKLPFDELVVADLRVNPIPYVFLRKDPKLMMLQELNKNLKEFEMLEPRLLHPFLYQYAKLWVGKANGLFATVIGLLLMMRAIPLANGVLIVTILCGSIIFFLSYEFCDLLGERGVLNPWLCSMLPYLTLLITVLGLLASKSIFKFRGKT